MIKYCILVLALLFATFFKTKRSLHMLQQNLYNENNRYLKWVVKNYKQFMDFDIILLLIAFMGSVVFYDLEVVALIGIVGLILVSYFIGFNWINRIKNDQNVRCAIIGD